MSAIKFYSTKAEYGEFSNFDKNPVHVYGKTWKTIEHAYQAQKTNKPEEQEAILKATTPREARNLGQIVAMRADWDQVKCSVMKECVKAKFTQHKHLQELLLSTDNEELIEDSQNDYFWGCGANGKGLNNLGKILMEVREEIRNDKETQNS